MKIMQLIIAIVTLVAVSPPSLARPLQPLAARLMLSFALTGTLIGLCRYFNWPGIRNAAQHRCCAVWRISNLGREPVEC